MPGITLGSYKEQWDKWRWHLQRDANGEEDLSIRGSVLLMLAVMPGRQDVQVGVAPGVGCAGLKCH